MFHKKLPIPIVNANIENEISELSTRIIELKKIDSNTIDWETKIDRLVSELYDLTEEEIAIAEGSVR